MWYADIRGHHGKRWNYEPSEWYMGRHNKRRNKNGKNKTKKYMVMSKFTHSDRFILEKQFINRHSADYYADSMISEKDYEDLEYFLFEQSVAYNKKDNVDDDGIPLLIMAGRNYRMVGERNVNTKTIKAYLNILVAYKKKHESNA